MNIVWGGGAKDDKFVYGHPCRFLHVLAPTVSVFYFHTLEEILS